MSTLCTFASIFPYGSSEFWSAVELRQRVLREPLGLTLTVAELMQEGPPMVHYGIFELRGVDELDARMILACATAVEVRSGVWKLRQVAVATEFQGHGFGKQVMCGMEHFLRHSNAHRFCLHARQSVQGFYTRLGYEVRGEVFDEIGLPHVLMEKTVVPSR